MIIGFIKIGFLEIGWFDLLDIFLVAVLLYQLYMLLRGSLAFTIFIGLIFFYMAYFVVGLLNMQLLSGILGEFIGVGVIALIIVFQPEIRRFLLLVGRTSQMRRNRLFQRFFDKRMRVTPDKERK
ncbi:MAG TPA: TIGR00159 family protein, partial [Flavobacterium sp.]|nr:TIGR00159 family protein [Flavobacterium sp.]